MTKDKWLGHGAILATNLIFGLNTPIAKTIVPEWISPYALTFVRMVFATLVFWGIGLLAPKEEVGNGIYGRSLGCLIRSGRSTSIFCLCPSVHLTGQYYHHCSHDPARSYADRSPDIKRARHIQKAAGVLIGASGALLIIFQSSAINTDSSGNWIGNLLCIVNVITYAIYLVITRPISQRYSAITLMKWMFLFSALISFPPGISDLPEAKVFGTESNPFVILKLSYIVIMATGIAYFLVPMALKRIRPTTASMYNNLQPIIASIIAILIGQDVFSWDKPIAALLVFTGVYLVTQSKAKEEVKGIK